MIKQIPEEIKGYILYNEHTGRFTRLKSGGGYVVGSMCGGIGKRGYEYISFKKNRYLSSRLAYWWITGESPEQVDHIDNNPLNNCFDNLRPATQSQNQHNRGKCKSNTSGYKGVSLHRATKKFCAEIWIDSKKRYLGLFNTPEEAHQAYCKAANELHKEFKNYG